MSKDKQPKTTRTSDVTPESAPDVPEIEPDPSTQGNSKRTANENSTGKPTTRQRQSR